MDIVLLSKHGYFVSNPFASISVKNEYCFSEAADADVTALILTSKHASWPNMTGNFSARNLLEANLSPCLTKSRPSELYSAYEEAADNTGRITTIDPPGLPLIIVPVLIHVVEIPSSVFHLDRTGRFDFLQSTSPYPLRPPILLHHALNDFSHVLFSHLQINSLCRSVHWPFCIANAPT
jgi:hypothetical protein